MMRKNIISLALCCLASLLHIQQAAAQDQKCNLYQTCQNNAAQYPPSSPMTPSTNAFCGDPNQVTQPVFLPDSEAFAPEIIAGYGASVLAQACPWIDTANDPLCCNNDNVVIMNTNFATLDGVFGGDCSICAVNLKYMWCSYACSPDKGKFQYDLGFYSGDAGTLPNVGVTIDQDYSCTIFNSCKQVSIVAQTNQQSSKSFLDFLGFNGAPYSQSYISFFPPDDEHTFALTGNAYPCSYDVPSDGMLEGYDKVKNSTCSYCADACSPPVVDDHIAFLDGFNWTLVGYTYLTYALFTILFQLVTHFFIKKRKIDALQTLQNSGNTLSTAAGTSQQMTQRVNNSTIPPASDQDESSLLIRNSRGQGKPLMPTASGNIDVSNDDSQNMRLSDNDVE